MGPTLVRRSNTRTILIVSIVVAVILAGSATYFFVKDRDIKNNPSSVQEATSQRIISEVGKLYKLPTGEQPTVAKITNISLLKNQSFFKDARDGDQLLIYQNAQIAILYRESTNKIINIGPISTGTQQAAATPSATPTTPKVAVLNGSNTNGAAATTGAEIASKLSGKVTMDTSYANATVKASKTIVVALTSSDASLTSQIATTIGGAVGSLPQGQTAPAGIDILVIVGG
jgi:hypothetical protein